VRAAVLALLVPLCGNAGQNWWERISIGGELRERAESTDEGYDLHRIRVNVKFEAASWLRFMAQAQDARIIGNDKVPSAPPYRDALDLRQGYAELGNSENGRFGIRVGRQEFIFGEQRLVGASNWANAARTFDAVRATWRPRKGYRFDAFASSVVSPLRGEFNNHVEGNNLHGIYGVLDKTVPKAVVEPYVFWRVAPNTDFKTTGARWKGSLPARFDYSIEMAHQQGHVAGQVMHAWGGHWVLGYTVRKLHWLAEYNYATGDHDPNDGRRTTFDTMYPTPHDKYGLTDRVGWRNIHHHRYGVEYKRTSKLSFVTNYHTWWLADTNDGLYNAPGALIVRKPVAPAHVGFELDGQAFYTASKHLQIGGGYGHLFPGAFLKEALPGRSFNFPYLMVTWTW
jgi:hypothetical protein